MRQDRMKQENLEPIRIDEECHQQLLNKIKYDELELRKLDLKRGTVHKKGTDIAWDDDEFVELEKERQLLQNSISINQKILDNAIIVQKKGINDQIDFGDIVRIKFHFSEDDIEEEVIKLVGTTTHDLNPDYQETSITSPVGMAVFERKIGETVTCQINKVNCSIEILEKLSLEEKKQNIKTKTLKKI